MNGKLGLMTRDSPPQDADAVRRDAAYRERIKHLEEHVAALTEAAIERETKAAADREAFQLASIEKLKEHENQIESYKLAYKNRVGELETQILALASTLIGRIERVAYLEKEVSALTEAANMRENRVAADRKAFQLAYNNRVGELQNRVGELEAEVAALTEAVIERTQAAREGSDRIVHLEAEVTALTEVVNERTQAARERSDRVIYLEAEVAALTEAVIERTQAAREGSDRIVHLEAEVAALTEAVIEWTQAARERSDRVVHLEAEVAALTAAAIQREKLLQEKGKTDYQILMIHQNLLVEFKDIEPDFLALYERCKPFTMTSLERLYSLHKCAEYIAAAGIAGDLAECGVWRGGSCMLMALGLIRAGDTGRHIYMYDTFEGHPRPDPDKDVDLWGNRGIDEWRRQEEAGTLGEWGVASLAEVRGNLLSTGYPAERLIFVQGMVETTVPGNTPAKLALLRLDTDWYESTRVALQHLYPKLAEGGVLIIDDYGHYRGQRQAVDEYFAEIGEKPLLHRIDYSCRVMVKRSRKQI